MKRVGSMFHFCILTMATQHPSVSLIFTTAVTCKRRKYIIYVCNQIIILTVTKNSQSQWPCGLRCGFAAACLLGLWARILSGV
jgi:hypothetical protein